MAVKLSKLGVFKLSLLLLPLVGSAADVIIRNATLIDGTGQDPVPNVTIAISDGKFSRVTEGSPNIDATVSMDAEGRYVVPGLVDMHTHPTFEIRLERPRMPFPDPKGLPGSDEDMREFIRERLPVRLQRFLASGVTTVLSAGGYWPYEIDIRDQIESGELTGPRMLVSSPLFTAPGGHPGSGICSGETWCVSKLSVGVADEEAARAAVGRFASEGAQAIKLVYDRFDRRGFGGPNLNFPRLSIPVMKAIVEEAGRRSLPVLAHAKTVDEMADVVDAGVDVMVHSALMENGSLETSDGRYLPGLLSERKLAVTTTIRSFHERLLAADPKQRARHQAAFDRVGPSLRAYADAGVVLLFGTDFDGAGLDPDPGDAVRSEAGALVAAGFSEMEVITMMTGNAAVHPLVPNNLGSIAPGKTADLLILSGNPLEDIDALTRPLVVIKAGRVVLDRR